MAPKDYIIPRRDCPMFADDMFIDGLQQVFSVRTGDFIGYHRPGQELPQEQQENKQLQEEQKDKNQLTLNL